MKGGYVIGTVPDNEGNEIHFIYFNGIGEITVIDYHGPADSTYALRNAAIRLSNTIDALIPLLPE